MLKDSLKCSITQKTFLHFFNEQIDLFFLLNSTCKKIFITDNTVFNLDSTKKFFSTFEKSENKICNNTNCTLYENSTYKNNLLIVLQPGEQQKTIENILSIVKIALDFSLTRKDTFCAIGGGVITDITAFVASIYKRGTFFEAVPTTLLAMVDASIGGKTGVDFENYKNIIGTFFPANNIFIFTDFVQSLPENEFKSGLAESIKTALLFDKKLYQFIEDNKQKILSRDKQTLFKIILTCAKLKAKIVKKDLNEKNIRMLLNFGHTFGHALESCAGFGTLSHGECVAWGISRSLETSVILKLCQKEYFEKVTSTLSFFGYQTSCMHTALQNINDKNRILQTMKNDKKNSSAKIKLILQKSLTKNIILEVSDKIILQALGSKNE